MFINHSNIFTIGSIPYLISLIILLVFLHTHHIPSCGTVSRRMIECSLRACNKGKKSQKHDRCESKKLNFYRQNLCFRKFWLLENMIRDQSTAQQRINTRRDAWRWSHHCDPYHDLEYYLVSAGTFF